jgi:CRP-like cAMP-binding protein
MPLSTCNCEGCELKSLFFENASTHEIEAICTQKVEKQYKKGELIIKEGDEIKEFTYLKEGLVKLYRTGTDRKEQIICFAGPLDFVSLLSLFSENRYNYSVSALTDSVTCSLLLGEIKQMAEHNGKFAISLIEKINKASDKIILTFLDVKQRRLYGRIAYILLYFSEVICKKDIFELPVSRKEIAEFIGMTTENVIRTMSELRKDSIIKISGKVIEIVDKEKLKRISEFS